MTATYKQPAEEIVFELDFTSLLGAASIASIAGTSVLAKGLVAPVAPLAILAQEAAGGLLRIRLGGGTDGELYLITAQVRDADNQLYEQEAELPVIDLNWSLPDIANDYLSPAQYVARFGLAETLQLTDARGSGRIDKPALEAALVDAGAEIDGYVASRYSVPLPAPVPPLIARLAADITRARLHGDHVPDAVRTRYEDARRTLERIATGQVQIPALAAAARAQGGQVALQEGPERLFTRDALKDF